MADGSITFSTALDNEQLEKELIRVKKKISSLENEIAASEQKKMPLVEQSKELSAVLDEAKAKMYEMQSAAKGTYAAEEIAEQKERVRGLQSEYNKVQGAVERYEQKIMEATIELNLAKENAGGLEQEIFAAGENADIAAQNSGRMAEALNEAKGHMDKFTTRVGKLASRVFVFTLITRALQSMRTWLGNVIKTNEEATAAIGNLKGALLTLAQPIINVIVPAFTALVNVVTKVVYAIARFVSYIFGTTVQKSQAAAKALNEQAEALGGVGAAADEAAGSLAGFDEINTISTETASGGGGGAASSGIQANFQEMIGGELDKIATLVGGALLALGAILTFSGVNIPLGLTLMALGAMTLASVIMQNWDAIAQALQGPIGVITAILSGALLVLGAVLAFSGANIPLGLGLMALGATGLAMAVAANWDTIEQALKGPIGSLAALLSTAFLVIGAVLAFSGANLPLGLGLMIAGAAGMASYAVANWDTVSTALQGPVGKIIGLLSGALLVLGSVLLFSGANIPLGLGLLAVGSAGLAATMKANWDTIQEKLQGQIGSITAMVSGAALALGAILAISGVALPLGLGLLAVGAVGITTSVIANWNKIQGILGGKIDAITALVSAALLVLGVILLFSGVAAPLGLGMLIAGGAGLAATVAPNWDFILDAIKGAWANIESWWSANAEKYFTLDYWKGLGKDMIDGLLEGLKGIFSGLSSWASDVWSSITGIFSSKNAKASVSGSTAGIAATPSLSSIPALASGAVIPPNRQFMAVLGDQTSGNNIEAPEDLIRKIVREEAGGSNTELLQEILEAIRAGQVIKVNETVLGRTSAKAINKLTQSSGKPVLLF